MKLKPYPKYKDSGIGWIGKIPEVWEVHKIKHLTENFDGKRIPISAEKREDGKIPYYGATGVLDYVKDFIFNEELLLVGEDGAPFFEPFKDVAYIINGKSWVNNHAHVLRVIGNNLIKWLCYYLNIYDYGTVIKGSTRDKLNQDQLSNMFIAKPSIKDQTAIANFLDSKTTRIDALIEKDKKLIELLKERRSALINHAVTKGLDPNAKMKDSGIDWIGEIPEGWEVRRLRFNALVNPSGKKVLSNPKTLVNFLPMEKVSENGEYEHESEAEYQNVSTGYTYFEDNDVLVAKITPCFENGKGTLVNNLKFGFGFGTTEFHVIRGYSYLIPRYLFYLTKTHFFRVTGEAFMEGTAGQKRVSTDFVKDFMMVTPPKTEQLEIVRYLDKATVKMDKTIQKIEEKIKLLEEYKKSLIHHTVTGKIDVRGSEI